MKFVGGDLRQSGTYVLSGDASLTINGTGAALGQNGLVIANQDGTNGTFVLAGGTLTVAGNVSLGSTATAAATTNTGELRIRGNDATMDVGCSPPAAAERRRSASTSTPPPSPSSTSLAMPTSTAPSSTSTRWAASPRPAKPSTS